jgi:two-component system, NtrC family, sensor kinase
MDTSISILIVEDSAADAALVLQHMQDAGLSVSSRRVETAEQMSAALSDSEWNAILCDYQLPEFDAPEALALLKATGRDIPFVVISGAVSEDIAVAMMKAGAQDYVPKSNLRRLVPAIQREMAEARRRHEHVAVEVRAGAIMEAAQEAIVMLDPEGIISFWNPAAEKIFGYSAKEALGKDLHALLAPLRYHAAFKMAYPTFQRTGEGPAIAQTLDLSALHKSGLEITISLSLSKLRLNDRWYAIGLIRDVTEDRRKEDQLRTLSRAIEFTPASIVITDPQGSIQYVNRKFLEVTGYEPDEVQGKTPRILKSGETPAEEYARMWSTIAQGGTWYGELHNKRKNGELYWEYAVISPIYNGQGQITHFIAVKEDITEKRITQDALRESEQLYRAIIDQSSEAIYLLDIESRTIIQANPKCSRLLGYDHGELIGMSIFAIVANPREAIDKRIDNLVRTKEVFTGERPYKRKDGSVLPVRVSSTVVFYANRSTLCTVFDDITEQKRQTEALKESEERFRLISENVADIILLFEPTGECIYASHSLLSLGCDPGGMKGQSVFALIHPEDRAGVAEQVAGLEETFAHRATAFRLLAGNGELKEMEATLSLLISDTGYRVVAVLRDVSERKAHERRQETLLAELTNKNKEVESALERLTHMQEGLVQSEKMASLGQLTAGIAHEINNPLAFVSSNLNRFREYFSDVRSLLDLWMKAVQSGSGTDIPQSVLAGLVAETRRVDLPYVDKDFVELMDHTRNGVGRIKKIVEQLRGFSHITKTEFALGNINQTIDETINLVWNELKYKVTVEKQYGDIPHVECNTGELQQVFVNLLVNAAHAIPEKGTITITTRSEGADIVIEITDTGQGIPDDHLNRIFDPFFTTKPVGKGTGLGLWIVSTIVQKHHGRIGVASRVGKGTTFTIRLPIQHGEEHKNP